MEREPTPSERPEIYEQAEEFIGRLQLAIELNARVKSGIDVTDDLIDEAKRLADEVCIESQKGRHFKLRVYLQHPTRGQISRNWSISDPHASEFLADEVTQITIEQVDFRHTDRDEYLTAFGHQMTIEPIF